ncbi:MAG: hypothetical protein ACUVWP_07535 [bacterium]
MRNTIAIILILSNLTLVFCETLTIEVYPSTETEGLTDLRVDDIDVGSIPVIISDIPVGVHNFTLTWVDKDGRTHHRSELINITSSERHLYLSVSEKTSGKRPFLYGLLGGAVFTIISGILLVH